MSSTLHQFPAPPPQNPSQKTQTLQPEVINNKIKENQETLVNRYMGNTVPKTDVWHFFVKYIFI